jgi:ferredoxin-NADP reductase/DMSO/TMAO reductase YedYZ heme-binding membrane subunit
VRPLSRPEALRPLASDDLAPGTATEVSRCRGDHVRSVMRTVTGRRSLTFIALMAKNRVTTAPTAQRNSTERAAPRGAPPGSVPGQGNAPAVSGPIGMTGTGSVGIGPSTSSLRLAGGAPPAPGSNGPLPGPFTLAAPLAQAALAKGDPAGTGSLPLRGRTPDRPGGPAGRVWGRVRELGRGWTGGLERRWIRGQEQGQGTEPRHDPGHRAGAQRGAGPTGNPIGGPVAGPIGDPGPRDFSPFGEPVARDGGPAGNPFGGALGPAGNPFGGPAGPVDDTLGASSRSRPPLPTRRSTRPQAASGQPPKAMAPTAGPGMPAAGRPPALPAAAMPAAPVPTDVWTQAPPADRWSPIPASAPSAPSSPAAAPAWEPFGAPTRQPLEARPQQPLQARPQQPLQPRPQQPLQPRPQQPLEARSQQPLEARSPDRSPPGRRARTGRTNSGRSHRAGAQEGPGRAAQPAEHAPQTRRARAAADLRQPARPAGQPEQVTGAQPSGRPERVARRRPSSQPEQVTGAQPSGRPERGARRRPSGRPKQSARRRPSAQPEQVARRWRTVATATVVLSLVAVVALWLSGGADVDLLGALRMADVAAGVVSLGRLAGLVATDLLMVQVLLMARIPVIERSFGQSELTRRHRSLGIVSFSLLLVHIALVTLGEGGHSGLDPIGQLLEFVHDYPGVLLATVGTAVLVLVVLTSRPLRHRLRYEAWHALHLGTYAAVALVIPHELLSGRDFGTLPVARAYWWALTGSALGAVLVWRVGRPLQLTLRHRLVVEEVVVEAPDVVSVHLSGRNLDRLRVAPGQFFTWRFLQGWWGWTRRHPFSLSAAPTADRLRITVKDVGAGTHRIATLRPGTRVTVGGPLGRLHAGVRTRRQVTLLAGGIGITPLRALLEDLDAAPGELTLLYRASSTEDVVFADELRALADARGAQVHLLVGPRRVLRRGSSWLPESAGSIGDVEALESLAPGIAGHDVYVCGPDPWLETVVGCLHRAGVPAGQIHSERFSWSDPGSPRPQAATRPADATLRPADLTGQALERPLRQARRAGWRFLRTTRPAR